MARNNCFKRLWHHTSGRFVVMPGRLLQPFFRAALSAVLRRRTQVKCPQTRSLICRLPTGSALFNTIIPMLSSPSMHPDSQMKEKVIPCAWPSPMKTSSDMPQRQSSCAFCGAGAHYSSRFSSAHFTIFSDGSRERLHGHNFTVAVDVQVRC